MIRAYSTSVSFFQCIVMILILAYVLYGWRRDNELFFGTEHTQEQSRVDRCFDCTQCGENITYVPKCTILEFQLILRAPSFFLSFISTNCYSSVLPIVLLVLNNYIVVKSNLENYSLLLFPVRIDKPAECFIYDGL